MTTVKPARASQIRTMGRVMLIRWVRRIHVELGVPLLPRRWATVVTAALLLLLLSVMVGIGRLIDIASGGEPGPVISGVILVVALLLPWLVGGLRQQALVATLTDPAHALARPALDGDGVLLLARLVIPAGAAQLLLGLSLAVLTVSAGILVWSAWVILLLGWAGYAGCVLAVRVHALRVRLAAVAALRRGSTGLWLLTALTLVQGVLAFALPFLGLWAYDRWSGAVSSLPQTARLPGIWVQLVAVGILGCLAVILARGLSRTMDAAAETFHREVLAHQRASGGDRRTGRARGARARDQVRVMLHKDWCRVNRLGGPMVGPALSSLGFGLVFSAFVMGGIAAGLFLSAGGEQTAALQMLSITVLVLLTMETASHGILPLTSPDADGSAAHLVEAVPGARDASVRAKALLHGAIVSVPIALLLVMASIMPAGMDRMPVSAAVLIGGSLLISVVEHVAGPAAYPRRDWATIEQIGRHPKAVSLGLVVSVGGAMVLAPLVVATRTLIDPLVDLGGAGAAAVVLLVTALALACCPVVTSTIVRRLT